MLTEKQLLAHLRKQIKKCYQLSYRLQKDAAQIHDSDLWIGSQIELGRAFAYEELIKHIKGIDWHSFTLQKKKGTL